MLAAVAALSCTRPDAPITAPGVSLELAAARAEQFADVRYDLAFTIPAARDSAVMGVARIAFRFQHTGRPLVLDFVDPLHRAHEVRVGGTPVEVGMTEDHLVIPHSDLVTGENTVEIRFTAGDEALNRNPEFLYTLHVPDRARYTFPVFDQPDIKARYTLALTVPDGWVAVGNGAPAATEPSSSPAQPPNRSTATLRFGQTEPISSYLFAFAAGRFEVEEAERGGRRFRMFHRETDRGRVERNRGAIFDLHAAALAWLEQYTEIPYPFGKFDFVAVPAFQYGGMEHPGSVFYRASSLFLEPTATQAEELGRASLISHETAHMWFGDLVTMRWFDDVWTKEVFANFMAAKIVNPSFPGINHDLRFLLAHHPAAYAVDRTAGANPIRQPLDNLREAGSLYGAIIYQKAPIAMRHLERRVGPDRFREGLREYLGRFRFANATWPDLIAILDARTPDDLTAWSDAWIEHSRRPTVATELRAERGTIDRLAFTQHDPDDLGRRWPQRLSPALVFPDGQVRRFDVALDAGSATLDSAAGLPAPLLVLANGDGLPYGEFVPDSASLLSLAAGLPDLPDDLLRAVGWLTLEDAMLGERLPPATLLATGRRLLETEPTELTVQRVLGAVADAYWRFLGAATRDSVAPAWERLLWTRLQAVPSRSLKAAYFGAYRAMARTDGALARLERLWREDERVPGLPLAERDFTALAQALAVREVAGWRDILERQLARITNADRQARFRFVMPALSADTAERDAFFASLADPANREHEPWVLEAVGALHHPLRAARAERYIVPSLELLEEIQRTGDIFFPLGWLNATLDGHNTPDAARLVRGFLERRPDLPARLRGKLLQAADGLERSARIVYGAP
jgi:aminopeptidase N